MDLPEPFGPMMAWTSPVGTTRSIPFRIALPSSMRGAQSLDLEHQPTDPSRLMASSFCASTANSIGSSFSTSLQKPLTIKPTASSWLRPRWRQ